MVSHTSSQFTGTPARSRGTAARRLPIGAEPLDSHRTHFRVWAPKAGRVDVVVENGPVAALEAEGSGYFSGVADAAVGARYRFRLNEGDRAYPDPASRFQPEGPHGPSEVVDPSTFEWSDDAWAGVRLTGQVIYELHIGTFTRAGTWAAAESLLPDLARTGITVVEVMPIADFHGRFGWGYDGVNLFAPTRLYGRPDDLRRFVDRAHALGLGVMLDVVYNHLGPVGNYLGEFSSSYLTDRHANEWGDAINFDGVDSGPVREYFTANAGYWIDEFHVDGLRLDATQQVFDASPEHILAAIGRRVRDAGRGRSTLLVAENETQETRLVRPLEEGGYGFDALWNDDFHHSAMVALTGRAEAYYSDTRGDPQELISAAKRGYLFQGQYYSWHQRPRGTGTWGLSPASFVTFLQNHDQVANTLRGLRGHQLTSPGRWRAMTALLLLMPSTPMLFQGQEFSASSPFLYFVDVEGDLADAVAAGREDFLKQFPSIAAAETRVTIPRPTDPQTFERCKLDPRERTSHTAAYALHVDLLRLRREDEAFRTPRSGGVDGAVLSTAAFVLRFFAESRANDRLLVVNLGPDLRRASIAEPLLSCPDGCEWDVIWSSEDPKYNGGGTPEALASAGWNIPGESAIVLALKQVVRASGPGIRRRTA